MPGNEDVPSNANEHCPGTQADEAGKADACAGCPNQQICASGAAKQVDPDLAAIAARMAKVKNKVLVLSGKGGVGKSTVSAQLALELASRGHEVGLLDIDICGPSIPRMMGLAGQEIHQSASGWSPVYSDDLDNLGVMSIGFMLPNPDDAVIWRGPRKNGLIKQFLKDVDWGTLDYLVVDSPPGTSDEHISIVQYLSAGSEEAGTLGAVIVTTPQEIALQDVRKEINFCKKTSLPVIGVVENMSGLVQPLTECAFSVPGQGDVTARVLEALQAALGVDHASAIHVTTDVFHRTSKHPAADMAARMGVPFLGSLPMDVAMGRACESGKSITQFLATQRSLGGDNAGSPGASGVAPSPSHHQVPSPVLVQLKHLADGLEKFAVGAVRW